MLDQLVHGLFEITYGFSNCFWEIRSYCVFWTAYRRASLRRSIVIFIFFLFYSCTLSKTIISIMENLMSSKAKAVYASSLISKISCLTYFCLPMSTIHFVWWMYRNKQVILNKINWNLCICKQSWKFEVHIIKAVW